MKNKAFTLVEMLVVVGISMGVAAVIFSVFIILNTGMIQTSIHSDLKQKAQLSLSSLQNYLEKASPDTITIAACVPSECNGDKITFQVPVVDNDAVTGTAFTNSGSLKVGAYYSSGETTYTVRNGFFDIYANNNNVLVLETWRWEESGGGSPPGPPGPCFLAGTPILMADSSTKPIEQIKVGDNIFAFDEKIGKLVEDKVTKFFEHDATEYLVVNDRLKLTANHPVYSEGKWREIGQLKIGDKLLNASGEQEKIVSIEAIKAPVKVYNLEVNPYHTYIAGGIVTHNKSVSPDDLWGKLFNDFLGVKEAYAELVKQLFKSTVLTENVKRANFTANATKTLITIQLHLEKTGLAGQTITYDAQSQIAPLIN